mgnify:CR=1 FL=1
MPLRTQHIESTNKQQVYISTDDYSSIMFTNTHATDAVTIDLYIVDQTGGYIDTNIDVVVNNSSGYDSVKGTSIQVAVDNGSGGASGATTDLMQMERVYNANDDFIGVCTSVNSSTLLTFLGGLYKRLNNNDVLAVGRRFHILNNMVIPNGASLQLERSDLSFDNNNYKMYINSSDANGNIDIITSI